MLSESNSSCPIFFCIEKIILKISILFENNLYECTKFLKFMSFSKEGTQFKYMFSNYATGNKLTLARMKGEEMRG